MTHKSSIALVDPEQSAGTRAARMLAGLGYHVEPYASVADLEQHWPGSGLMLVRDTGDLPDLILERALPLRPWMPVVVFGPEPCASRICAVMIAGAIGYLAEPFDPDLVRTYVERTDERLVRAIEEARRRADAARRIAGLSHRERDVLRLLSVGGSNKWIGNRLSISPRTVEIHRANMIRKIGARSTSDAIRIAAACDLDTSETA